MVYSSWVAFNLKPRPTVSAPQPHSPDQKAARLSTCGHACRTSYRYGGELVVENFGPLRYERGADDVAAGRALLQRHEASAQDLANFAGQGVLVGSGGGWVVVVLVGRRISMLTNRLT